MHIIIKTPTKALIIDPTREEIDSLKKSLTYTNKSVQFQMSSWAKNFRMKKSRPAFWQSRYEELKSNLKECILKMEKDGTYSLSPGILSYLGLNDKIISNEVDYPPFKPINFIAPLPFTLYPYQEECIKRLKEIRHGHINLCTSAGKSMILLNLAKEIGLNSVVVVPSKQIFNEITELFIHHLGEDKVGKFGDGKKDIQKPITVAIAKSLTMLESGTKEYDFFASKKALICDESHLVAAETLERVCSGVLKDIPYRMFMSGTNVRGDGKDIVLQGVIGPWVYELDTKTAIEGGFLCPLKFTVIKTFSPTNKKEIDPMKTKRTHFLYNKEVAKKIALIANSSANKLNESSLILVEELRQIADIIKLLEVPYAYCHSASKKDASEWGLEQVNTKDSIEKFNSGEVKVIIGTSCIDTGVNLYPCHNTFNWVGGSSEVTTKQGTIGRSVRKLENSKYKQFHKPKPVSKVYDFDVEGQPILQSQLRRRLEFYKETGCPVIIV